MSIKERIHQFIEYKRFSVLAFEKTAGLSNGYIYNTKSISAESCTKILTAFPEISSEWLLLGRGEMLREKATKQINSQNTTHSFNSNTDETIKELTSIIKTQEERIRQLTDKLLQL